MNETTAKESLDSLIKKARVHLYKPIQIAEILHRDRTVGDISISDLETYRNASKRWRNEICLRFLGRISTSSARYQDDVFNENAISPDVLKHLANINNQKNGIVEAYIYRRFLQRMSQMSTGLIYVDEHNENAFELQKFLDLFWHEPGLKRSIGYHVPSKVIVYAWVNDEDTKQRLRKQRRCLPGVPQDAGKRASAR